MHGIHSQTSIALFSGAASAKLPAPCAEMVTLSCSTEDKSRARPVCSPTRNGCGLMFLKDRQRMRGSQ